MKGLRRNNDAMKILSWYYSFLNKHKSSFVLVWVVLVLSLPVNKRLYFHYVKAIVKEIYKAFTVSRLHL